MTKRDFGRLKLAFLFLIADGKVTKEKYDAFDTIGNNLDDFKDYRRNIINSCLGIFGGNISEYSDKNRFSTIRAAIWSLANDELSYYNRPSKTQLECFWMLISLAYNRGQLTQNKKVILKEVCEKWEIKTAIAAEMMDTAETIISIDEHKKWLSSPKEGVGLLSSLNPFKKGANINNAAVNSELDKNQNELIKSINLLIEDESQPLDEDEEDEEDEEWEEEDDEEEYEDEDGEAPDLDKDWIEGEEEENDEDEDDDDDDEDNDSKDIWS